jgi:outer membrane protein OmpA-like peptidoglycan-associated protein
VAIVALRGTLTPVKLHPSKWFPNQSWLSRHRAARVAPAALVFTALAASGGLFYFVTSKRLAERQTNTPSAATPPPPATTAPVAAAAPSAPSAPTSPAPPPPPAKPQFGFARPIDLGKDLAQSLTRRDWPRAAALAAAGHGGEEQTALAKQVLEKIHALGFSPDASSEVQVLGQVERYTRIAIPLKHADGRSTRLQLDVERDEDMGWKIAQFRLPTDLAPSLAAPTAPEAPADAPTVAMVGATGDKVAMAASAPTTLFAVEEQSDPLSVADEFVKKLLAHDFGAARGYLDESRVPSERLAGLCIVFEEGQYQLLAGKPLVMTAAGADASWVIAQVKSEKLSQQTEFGIELQRQAEDQPWQVVGLNLSDILGSFARSASQLGVPYTPIVKNPRGGESLALYFEYDESGLHPRALKQIQIVSDMLKSDAKRRLRIAGHTDALGEDSYNLRLSQQRAEAVKKQLVDLGVNAEQIDTTGMGKLQPLGPNQKSDGSDDPEGRSKNRRAEIYLDF